MAQEFKEVAHLKVDQKAYGDGWDRIFNNKPKTVQDMPEYQEAIQNRDWQTCDILSDEFSAKEEVAEVVAEKKYDHLLVAYCVFLACLGCLFLGSEISDIQHSAEMRKAQGIIDNCNNIIVGKKK